MAKAPPPKPTGQDVKTIMFCGNTVQSLRARAKKRVARDSRSFKTKAMEITSLFRERQLQMQEKQREMLTRMQGPDWPKEDWPLTNTDAKHVGDAENIIHSGLDELGKRLANTGGVAQVHETQDEGALEILIALGDMMSCYTKLIDRHAEKVKRSQKRTGRKDASEEEGSRTGLTEESAFDSKEAFGSLGSLLTGSSLGDLARVGSSLGGLRPEPDLNAWGGLRPPSPTPNSELESLDSRWTAAQPVYNDVEL